MTVTRKILSSAATVALCTFAAVQPAAAQHPAHMKAAVPHLKPTTRRDSRPTAAENERRENTRHFRGIASKLNTTPEAMEEAFESARQANHRLSRGEFIAANMLALDLGAGHPGITTQAILDQLKSGNNLGRALQRLGLSRREAKDAIKTADHEVKEADKAVKDKDRDRDATTT